MATSSLSPHTSIRPFLVGQNHTFLSPHRPLYSFKTTPKHTSLKPIAAKFNVSELMGGRGLCNGEAGIAKELNKNSSGSPTAAGEAAVGLPENAFSTQQAPGNASADASSALALPEDAFEKEMLGLTGGFPGGEKGLKKFIQENPPPKKGVTVDKWVVPSSKKVKPPELPLLLPGMIAIVKNPSNPFYMYCGIVQRITDGKAGVLFEGGNWDRLVTFRLEELERREKGPPMTNPKSVVLEPLVEQLEKQSSQQ